MGLTLRPVVLGDRYEILGSLGEGGMGNVFRVKDKKNQNIIALKSFKNALLNNNPSFLLEGFKGEFEILKNLRHPHIAKIYDFGVDLSKENEKCYFFTEELIEGRDLWNASRNFSYEIIEDLFVQALRALEFLHTNHVYHLDLKPTNLMVLSGERPKLKIIDFGLSGFKDTKIILGTPSYTSPEVILGLQKGPSADLYSLGVIFYKCLTGKNPFYYGDIQETWNRHLHFKPNPPSSIKGDIPKYMDIILMNLLEKKPSDRYPSAAYVIRSMNYLSGKQYAIETEETFVSYLPEEGRVIGRDLVWQQFTDIFRKQRDAKSGSHKVVVLHGPYGTGKTRLLKEMKHFAQLNEASVCFWRDTNKSQNDFLMLADFDAPLSKEDKKRVQMRKNPVSRGLSIFGIKAPEDLRWFQKEFPGLAVLSLKNFDLREVRHYILSTTGLSSLPGFFVKQLYQRCEGNPLLLKEMLQALIQSGELLLLEGHLDEKALLDFSIPWEKVETIPGLEIIFSDRWRTLTSKQKEILTLISFLGKGFFKEEKDGGGFKELVKKGWLVREESVEYRLANPSFVNLIQGRLSKEECGNWHNRAAALLEKGGEDPFGIYYHQSFGGDKNLALSALPHFIQFALKKEKWNLLKPALDRSWELGVRSPIWGEAMLKWVKFAMEGGKKGEILEAFQKMEDLSIPEKPSWPAEIMLAKITLNLKEKDYQTASLHLNTLFSQFGEGLPVTLFLRAKNIEGKILMEQGKLKMAEEVFRRNFEKWLQLEDAEKQQVTNNGLATCFFRQEKYEECWEQLQQELPCYLQLNNTVLLATSYYLLGCSAQKLKKTVEGINYLKQCMASAKTIQETDLLLLTYNELGNLYYNLKQLDEARIHFEHALNLAQKKGNQSRMALIAANLGVVHADLGQNSQCFSFLQLATRILDGIQEKSVDNWIAKGLVLLELSRYCQRQEEKEEAKKYIREAHLLMQEKAALQVLKPQIVAQYENLFSKGESPPNLKDPMEELQGQVSQMLKRLEKLESMILDLSTRKKS